MDNQDESGAVLASLRERFATLPPRKTTRREREAMIPSQAERRALQRAAEIKNAQIKFNVTPSFRATFFAAAQARGISAIELLERMYAAYTKEGAKP